MPHEVKRVRRKRRSKEERAAARQQDNWRILLLIGLVIAGFGIVTAVVSLGRTGYDRWRESTLLKEADRALRAEQIEAAARAAREALAIAPESLPALRVLAETAEKQNRPEAVRWRAQIAKLEPRELQSHLNYASAALRFNQLAAAQEALAAVPPSDRDKAGYHVVAGWLARAQGDSDEVERHFAAALKQEPGNELYQFNLAVLQINSPDPKKNADARAVLERLSKVAGFRTGSLRGLLNDALRRGDFERADGLAQDLQMSQHVTFADSLVCLDLYRKMDPKRFAALLEKVKPVAARNSSDLAALLGWMNANGLAPEVLNWTAKLPAEVVAEPPAATQLADACAQTKNWSRLKRWTRSGAWGADEYLRLAYQSLAVRQSKQAAGDAEADALWRAADQAAGDDAEREIHLARLGTRWNLGFEAEQLWTRVARNEAHRREALDALYAIFRGRDDVANLKRTAQRLHEISPGDPVITANFARFALLLDRDTTEAQRLAKEAYEKAPTDPSCVVTHAFSLYGHGRTAEAIEVIKTLTPEQLGDPHVAAFYSVLLLDEGRGDEAAPFVQIAQAGPLFAEEKKLLEEALSKVGPH